MYDNQTGSGIGGVFDMELSTLQYLKLISPALRKNDYIPIAEPHRSTAQCSTASHMNTM